MYLFRRGEQHLSVHLDSGHMGGFSELIVGMRFLLGAEPFATSLKKILTFGIMILKSHTGATDEINCFFKKKVLMILWEFFCLLIFCPNKDSCSAESYVGSFLHVGSFLQLPCTINLSFILDD